MDLRTFKMYIFEVEVEDNPGQRALRPSPSTLIPCTFDHLYSDHLHAFRYITSPSKQEFSRLDYVTHEYFEIKIKIKIKMSHKKDRVTLNELNVLRIYVTLIIDLRPGRSLELNTALT